jgi:hypothetical protein
MEPMITDQSDDGRIAHRLGGREQLANVAVGVRDRGVVALAQPSG